MNKQQEEIFLQLCTFVGEIIGSDVVDEVGISYDTVFTDDLEMDSIELVAFAEKVKNKYGQKTDFIKWLSGLGLENIYKLSIGEVVDYIAARNDSHQ
jgi:acyl carrier protein